MEVIGISDEMVTIILSALAAAISFAAFAFPFLQSTEKKEHYKNVIAKKRKALMETAKQDLHKKGGEESLSAKESVEAFFKLQSLAGELGEKIREQLLQAGIRSPTAPLTYLTAQILLPVFFVLLSMFFMSASDKEVDDGVKMIILVVGIFSGFYLPQVLVKNQGMKRIQELNITFPDALDMMLICVQGGIGLEQTIDKVAEEIAEHSPVLAEELGILSAEMSMLSDRRAALSDFGKRVGGTGKSFATSLIQAEQYGTSMSQALKVMSEELREMRMATAEQKAASLPPKLTVPMILFFLPALFIVILGPAIIGANSAGVGG